MRLKFQNLNDCSVDPMGWRSVILWFFLFKYLAKLFVLYCIVGESVFTKQPNGNLFLLVTRLGRNSKKSWAFWKLIKLILRSLILLEMKTTGSGWEKMFLERRNLRMGFRCLLRSLMRSSIVGWDLVSLKIFLHVCLSEIKADKLWGSVYICWHFSACDLFLPFSTLDSWWRINS